MINMCFEGSWFVFLGGIRGGSAGDPPGFRGDPRVIRLISPHYYVGFGGIRVRPRSPYIILIKGNDTARGGVGAGAGF